MPNKQNLKPKSSAEARENGRKGGIASGKAKRQRKAMKEQLELLLALPLKNEKAKKQIEKLGIDSNEIDNQMAMLISMYNTVLKGGKGSVQAFKAIQDTVENKEQGNAGQSLAETIQKAYEDKAGGN